MYCKINLTASGSDTPIDSYAYKSAANISLMHKLINCNSPRSCANIDGLMIALSVSSGVYTREWYAGPVYRLSATECIHIHEDELSSANDRAVAASSWICTQRSPFARGFRSGVRRHSGPWKWFSAMFLFASNKDFFTFIHRRDRANSNRNSTKLRDRERKKNIF